MLFDHVAAPLLTGSIPTYSLILYHLLLAFPCPSYFLFVFLPHLMAPAVALDDTLGAAFIGDILAACLYGLTTLQTYIYYGRSGRDLKTLKSLIAFLWFLDTLHLLLISHTVYVYAVSGFGNLLALLEPTWSILAHIIVTGISDGCWLCATIALSSCVAFGGSLAYPIKGFQLQTYFELENVSWLLYFSLSTALVTDLIIAATLCILLASRRTVFTRVNLTVRTLILYTVNTGALTTLCALVCLIAYAATPHSFVYITFYFLLPKLFLNSLLATLNARKSLREQMRGAAVALPLELSPTYGGETVSNEVRTP
ncbi:hypothetical protein BD310DRAFT_683566 [Dichomitus squalens]|uniref:DUF6534 domain-containing protein n=1 Tax=Dichomitus squalens TaxID=114155 RepID=A0A4Q9PMR3_9APHY|nr:hypothetical protein BD310DRAFT_683566 [Dichomitus squalens]